MGPLRAHCGRDARDPLFSSLLLPCATISGQLIPKLLYSNGMKNIYLAASVRTPIGRFGGTLASWTAADLGVAVAQESLRRAGLQADEIHS